MIQFICYAQIKKILEPIIENLLMHHFVSQIDHYIQLPTSTNRKWSLRRKIKEQWSQQCHPTKFKRWVTNWSPLGKWNRKSHTIWLMLMSYCNLLDSTSKLKQQEVEEYLPRVTPKNCTTINWVPSPHLQINKIYHDQYN